LTILANLDSIGIYSINMSNKPKKIGVTISRPAPIKTSPEIERMNRHVRQMKALSNKDFVINLLEKIIDAQKHNKLAFNRDNVKIGFYELGIENDSSDVSKTLSCLNNFKKQGRIEDFSYNGANYTIVKPDIKKLQDYISNFEDIGNEGINLLERDIKNQITPNKKILQKIRDLKTILLKPESDWENIIIKILDENRVGIYEDDEFLAALNNIEFGFCRSDRNKSTDKKWGFLNTLSLSEGVFDIGSLRVRNFNEYEKHKKYVEEIRVVFKKVFGLSGDPFKLEDGCYKTKFKIEPAPVLRGDGEVFMRKGGYLKEV
jgi:hypothetical protein